jgi:putative transposase
MKQKRFTEEQIVKALKGRQAGETVVAIRELGVHEQTLYNWKSKYGGLEVNELVVLKRLREDNR